MDSNNNSSDCPDRQSAEPMTLKPRNPFTECKTIGEMMILLQKNPCERTRQIMPPEFHEKLWRTMFRYCEEWPDWVLKAGSEVIHVHVPTIPKHTILETLRWLNHLVFVARIDDNEQKVMPKLPEFHPEYLGAIVGHTLAIGLYAKDQLEEARDILPPDKLAEFSEKLSLERFQNEISPFVGEFLLSKPSNFIAFQKGFCHAQCNTFDKNGRLKETPRASFYREIFSNWPEIECMSGPKELTLFLLKDKGNADFYRTYASVKMMCSRLGITFAKPVKEI